MKTSEEVTLSLLISDWLRDSRNTRWVFNSKASRLEMKYPEPLEPRVTIYDSHVEYDPAEFGGCGPRVILNAADPEFFSKLRLALIHEEKWCHFCRTILLLIDAIEFLCGPLIVTTCDGIDKILEVSIKFLQGIRNIIGPR